MGTVSNPAAMSSIKAAWASAVNNFSAYVRGGSIVNIGDSASIPTAAVGMRMSQFNGVAAAHGTSNVTSRATTTSYTTTYATGVAVSRNTTTSYNTLYPVCLEEGTLVTMASGDEIPVEELIVGMKVASIDLPGLEPETTAREYMGYQTPSIQDSRRVPTKVAHIVQDVSSYIVEIWFAGRVKPLRVTPSHPLFVYDSKLGVYRFIRADQLDQDWHRLLNDNFELVLINDIEVYEGEFVIYKVDCSPLDVFFHNGVLGHNMKPGGGYYSVVVTSRLTLTSYTSYHNTSNVTSHATTTSFTTSYSTFG